MFFARNYRELPWRMGNLQIVKITISNSNKKPIPTPAVDICGFSPQYPHILPSFLPDIHLYNTPTHT